MTDIVYYSTAFPAVLQARFHGGLYKDSKTARANSIESQKAVNSARADSNGCAAVLLISFFVAVNLIRINADAFHAGTVHQFPVWFYFPLSRIL
ncbi:MAG: hypothetical protein Q3X13_08285, partial [Oscillospiraceae bacterium]|nr:hypothetical protein [Oscillospiraceae bacterium]